MACSERQARDLPTWSARSFPAALLRQPLSVWRSLHSPPWASAHLAGPLLRAPWVLFHRPGSGPCPEGAPDSARSGPELDQEVSQKLQLSDTPFSGHRAARIATPSVCGSFPERAPHTLGSGLQSQMPQPLSITASSSSDCGPGCSLRVSVSVKHAPVGGVQGAPLAGRADHRPFPPQPWCLRPSAPCFSSLASLHGVSAVLSVLGVASATWPTADPHAGITLCSKLLRHHPLSLSGSPFSRQIHWLHARLTVKLH